MTQTVGERVVALRQARGWTQQQLAVAAGLHQASIQNIERGRQGPSNASAIALARAFGVSLDELLTGSEPVTPAPSP